MTKAGFYVASKARSSRPGWSISFRHPLRNDSKGRPGLKMRRGLGTSNDEEADHMVSEMNEILSDEAWWNASKRQDAERRFSESVVKAFFDEIQAGTVDTERLRDSQIAMPSRAEGYSRVLFVGTTGAGKTSLVRQFIGSDPENDRFPSTAPAKTTIADIEIIRSEGVFEAAVTFFSEFQTQANVEECILDACLVALEDADDAVIVERLLNHRDQKFRLSYILGTWTEGDNEEDGELSFDAETTSAIIDEELAISDDDRRANRVVLEGFVARIKTLTNETKEQISSDLGVDSLKVSGPDYEAAIELIEENFESALNNNDEFHNLVHDVLDEVRGRFKFVEGIGQVQFRRSGWPELWTFVSEDRQDFISKIRWFSSNYWPQFGRLLTPLVEGIRVKGPLFADFETEQTKIVLIDGQGLGHTPESSASLTTHITKKFDSVDVILLVDNAQQPMQAAPLSVLRSVMSSGHNEKLAVAFTHFDQIKGHNLRSFPERRAHVMASVLNALGSLRESLGVPIVRTMERSIDERCFMLGGVDKRLSILPPRAAEYMREQLAAIMEFSAAAILPPPAPEARPEYDPTGISFAVQEAADKFRGPWSARLGLGSYQGVSKEHWTRIKALSRRLAGELNVEYDTLRPVADMVARLSEAISRFLDKPISWTVAPVDEEQEQSAIAEVRRNVFAALHSLAMRRLVDEQLSEWREVYDGPRYRGVGSASRRASSIGRIYESAAPLPDAVMTPVSAKFLAEVRELVIAAIRDSGGNVRLSEAAE
jgi:hypothetical protein